MDSHAQLMRDAAQSTHEDVLIPVAKWGSILSPNAQRFFASGYLSTGESVAAETRYFNEVLHMADQPTMKAGLHTIHAVVRAQSRFFESLCDNHIVDRLTRLLRASDTQVADKSAWLLSGMMARYPLKFSQPHVHEVMKYKGSEQGRLDVIANLLKFDGFREEVWSHDKEIVVSGLESTAVPMVYKALMCVWLASFNSAIVSSADSMPAAVISNVNKVLAKSRTEKVIRMTLQAIKNLIKSKRMCEEMAEGGTVDAVAALEFEKWRDADLVELIKEVVQDLNVEVKLLTNFERFEREVQGGSLKWGFIHSEKFWLENVLKCESHNFRVVDHLLAIACTTSASTESIAVACHDIGEFARLHPAGKQVAISRGAKDKMLELMSSSEREVAREALLCVQKLMLQKMTSNAQF